MGVLEDEVKEKKSKEIFTQVAKACSIGAQMTLIMGGGALLFRCVLCGLPHQIPAVEKIVVFCFSSAFGVLYALHDPARL